MKKIAVLTRDCAGINAAIRSVVRTACDRHIKVVGVVRGFDGLIDGQFIPLQRGSVSGIINLGGTILKTARSTRFLLKSQQHQAIQNLEENNIDGLIVIGGNGSLCGAHLLATQSHVHVVGIPATIDNDVNGVDFTIGADTAVNVALDALDKIRDTATSLERIFIVEVMGRDCGYIALQVGLAAGCEEILIPERKSNIDFICREINQANKIGKSSWIIIVSEGKAKASDVAALINKKTGFETRIVVLGHIQRGGRPTAIDRILAARLGNYAVKVLEHNQTDVCVGVRDGKLITLPIADAIRPKKMKVEEYYDLIKVLSK